MVAFVAGEAEGPFFQDRVSTVPEGNRETDILVAIANTGETVFVPPVGAGAGLVVGEGFPGVTVGAVVFAHGTPGPFTQIGPPPFPMFFALGVGFEPLWFGQERRLGMGVGLAMDGHTTPSVDISLALSRGAERSLTGRLVPCP